MKKGTAQETALAIFAGIALIAGALGIYWTRGYGLKGDLVYAPGLLFTSVSIVSSLFALFRRRWPMALRPLMVNAILLGAFIFLPWGDVSTRIDFQMKKQHLEEVAQSLQTVYTEPTKIAAGQGKQLEYDKQRMFTEIELAEEYQSLTTFGLAYTADTACGKFVYFPTQPDFSQRRSGFLFTPACEQPKNFPGVGFDVRWWPAKNLSDRWSAISGT